MEEKTNVVLEDIQMNNQEIDAPVEKTELLEATIPAEEKNDDSVTLFGKIIPKKPLIIASAIAVAAIILAVTLILVFSKYPIAKFFAKMKKEDNYQLTITLSDIPLFGTIKMQAKQDGNVSYTSAWGFGSYTERVGDDIYEYTKDLSSGNWIKEKQESADESESNTTIDQLLFEGLLDIKNYYKVNKNMYKQKNDVHFDDYHNVVITLDGDSCTINMDATSEGTVMHVEIVISNIGRVELILPEVQ